MNNYESSPQWFQLRTPGKFLYESFQMFLIVRVGNSPVGDYQGWELPLGNYPGEIARGSCPPSPLIARAADCSGELSGSALNGRDCWIE